mmetsp:Transcript_9726/g.12783  ORF Transcript_9726/g.12783 Transcript_9726/m.12783 type:complete len:445 (-) Transcript_9726:79-1413(-)
MIKTTILFVACTLCNAQTPTPTTSPTSSPSLTFTPTMKPTNYPTFNESTMGSVRQALLEGLVIACGVAIFGIFLGCANWKQDRERAAKKLNKALKYSILRDELRRKSLPKANKEDQIENIEYFKERYYPGDRVVVLKRTRKDKNRMEHLSESTQIDDDVELKRKDDTVKFEKMEQGKNKKIENKNKMENVHKKKIGEHESPYNMHAHGVWSVEELEEGAIGVTRGKTGVVTRCADHVNRYIIEFDEKDLVVNVRLPQGVIQGATIRLPTGRHGNEEMELVVPKGKKPGHIVKAKMSGSGTKYIPTLAMKDNHDRIRKSSKLFVYDIIGITSKYEQEVVKAKYPDRDFDEEELDEIANEPNALWGIVCLLLFPLRLVFYYLTCKKCCNPFRSKKDDIEDDLNDDGSFEPGIEDREERLSSSSMDRPPPEQPKLDKNGREVKGISF